MACRVVVVGSVNLDLVVRVARLPAAGETVTGGAFEQHHGGKGGNQAVAAARLGASVAFVGAIGGDDFGRAARAALVAEKIDVTALGTVDDVATGVAIIAVDARGENLIAVASGANGVLARTTVGARLAALGLGAGDLVLVGHEIPTPATREALSFARAAGLRTVLNPAPAVGLDRSVFGLADILTPNRTELRQLVEAEQGRTGARRESGDDVVRAASTLLGSSSEGPGVREAVVVTLGAAGAIIVRPDGNITEVPALPVDAVDSTGAGDAFNGALAAGLARGRQLDEAVRLAVAAAGLSTTVAGAREGMPTASELEAYLAAH
jgi:ribokinase